MTEALEKAANSRSDSSRASKAGIDAHCLEVCLLFLSQRFLNS